MSWNGFCLLPQTSNIKCAECLQLLLARSKVVPSKIFQRYKSPFTWHPFSEKTAISNHIITEQTAGAAILSPALIVRSDFADLPQNSHAATHTHSTWACECEPQWEMSLCNCTGCLFTLQLYRMSGYSATAQDVWHWLGNHWNGWQYK